MVRVAGERAALDEEHTRRLTEQPSGGPPPSKALKEGWLLWAPSTPSYWQKVLRRKELANGGRKVYVRLTSDLLALYAELPGSTSSKSAQPFEVMFLPSVSAVLGREPGSELLRVVHARGEAWELRVAGMEVDSDSERQLPDWGKCIMSRLGHFKQARRQSQRITVSTIARIQDTSRMRRKAGRKAQHCLNRWLPSCCDGCFRPSPSGTEFALTRRFSLLKEPAPYRGDVEFHSELVDAAKLKEVSDPELQEAQGVHWSEMSVRFLKTCYMVPEELMQDFTLTLRMGAPDGLKRLIWPLAAGEAVEPPRLAGSSASRATSSSWRDPDDFYKSATCRAFGGVDPKSLKFKDPVPTFCQGIAGMEEAPALKSVVKNMALLNHEGWGALRRLCWAIQLTCHQVEFCPFLPNLMCTLLAFFSEAETMMIVTTVLKKAEVEPENAAESCSLRMVVTSMQLNMQAKVFVREGLGKPLTGQALRHLESLGFDLHALAAELLVDGLASRLPFRAFCRVCGSFLREGSEAILRYGLALLKIRCGRLVACSTVEEAKKELDNLGEGMTSFAALEDLTKAAFSRLIEDNTLGTINSQWGSSYVAPKTGDYRRHLFCRPRLFAPRGLCPDEAWEVLWGWVPTSARIFDPHLVYTPSRQGTSLRTLLEISKKHAESPMIFFCYSKQGDLLGGYSPGIWVRTHGYVKTSNLRRPAEDAFVFRKLSGKDVEVWPWSGKNDMLFDASELHGLTFGGQSAAISISKDLLRCTSSASASFDSPLLVVPHDAGAAEAQGEDSPGQLLLRSSSGSVQMCGKESVDFEMLAFEVFALL